MPAPALILHPVPALADNYIWLLHSGQDGHPALVVDPGDASPVEAALDDRGLTLGAILVTHHHADHTQGIARMRARWPQLRVLGPADEAIDGLTERVRDGDEVDLAGQRLRVWAVPGHTAGHIAYVIDRPSDDGAPIVFCGDTLFSAGCGRLFEGSPAQMQASLARLRSLPGATRVCCTHEYTLANLRFARAVDPDNAALAAREAACQALRAAGQPTLPSTVALECQTNPFLRWDAPSVQQAARRRAPHPADGDDAVAVFTALRRWKDEFR
jgi:hydroxyacylglutathione hydrolase